MSLNHVFMNNAYPQNVEVNDLKVDGTFTALQCTAGYSWNNDVITVASTGAGAYLDNVNSTYYTRVGDWCQVFLDVNWFSGTGSWDFAITLQQLPFARAGAVIRPIVVQNTTNTNGAYVGNPDINFLTADTETSSFNGANIQLVSQGGSPSIPALQNQVFRTRIIYSYSCVGQLLP